MNKPKLSEEQAKALEALKDIWRDDESYGRRQLVKEKLSGGWSDSDLDSANSIDDDDFLAALYIGYEVEQSPEDKLRGVYSAHKKNAGMTSGYGHGLHAGYVDGIETTLSILGIQIEGINAGGDS